MYRLLRSIKVKPATAMESIQIAQEIANYVNKNYPKVNVQVCIPIFSELQKIVWFADYESLTFIQELNLKIMADEKYMAIVLKLADKIIEGSGKDELFQSL
jgi:hypothetical protein